MWIELSIIKAGVATAKMINTDAYKRIEPWEDDDTKTLLTEKGGLSIVLEADDSSALIADVPYPVIARQMRLFAGAVDVSGVSIA